MGIMKTPHPIFRLNCWTAVFLTFSSLVAGESASLPRLMVSDNNRYLVTADAAPFFYLGDTAWELFHRLNREEAIHYLENRASKGFTVIQAVALAELDGINTPNAYGHRPLLDGDPTRPDVKDGPANDYWDHVDFITDKANSLGLYMGFLPTWGDKWNKKWGVGDSSFTRESAAVYGEWIGRRYKDKGIIWILGGDRPVENDQHRDIIRAMAEGLGKGDGGAHLKTFHPPGGEGSSTWWHTADWLDFNMRQNGHMAEFTGRYDKTRADYDRIPVKPVIDSEPIYEDHPVSFNAKEFGHSLAADVRRPLYWDLFSGACGHTYAMVYAPVGRAFKVRMDKVSGPVVKGWWFNPRTGEATAIGEFPNTGEREFTPPDKGEMLDWVLVLDDAAKQYPAPGTKR